MLTDIILALFAAFWAVEGVAHFTNYRYGKTLSALIWVEEKHYPVAARVVVGALLAVLASHLELHFP